MFDEQRRADGVNGVETRHVWRVMTRGEIKRYGSDILSALMRRVNEANAREVKP